MKSNKVRMELSRDMHNWFKGIDAKTNDERMRLLRCMAEANGELAVELAKTKDILNWHKVAIGACRNNNRILKNLLAISVTISIISVSYLAYLQGWLL